MARRKIKPTHMERTIFGDGTGNSLNNVRDIEGVGRVGQLACWEHTQPLLKYHTITLDEEVHVAAWPPLYEHKGGAGLWSISRQGMHFIPNFSPHRNLFDLFPSHKVVEPYPAPMP